MPSATRITAKGFAAGRSTARLRSIPRVVSAARMNSPFWSVDTVPTYDVLSPSAAHADSAVAIWPPGERSWLPMRSFDSGPSGTGYSGSR
jgi:hypothetical protein